MSDRRPWTAMNRAGPTATVSRESLPIASRELLICAAAMRECRESMRHRITEETGRYFLSRGAHFVAVIPSSIIMASHSGFQFKVCSGTWSIRGRFYPNYFCEAIMASSPLEHNLLYIQSQFMAHAPRNCCQDLAHSCTEGVSPIGSSSHSHLS